MQPRKVSSPRSSRRLFRFNKVLQKEYNLSLQCLRRVQKVWKVKGVFVRLKPSSFHLQIGSTNWSQCSWPFIEPPKVTALTHFVYTENFRRFHILTPGQNILQRNLNVSKKLRFLWNFLNWSINLKLGTLIV